jgi:hypothetical protein
MIMAAVVRVRENGRPKRLRGAVEGGRMEGIA